LAKLINREKAKIQADKSEALRQIREEVAGMIAVSLEKVLGEKLDKAGDEKHNRQAVKQLD
jgi:F0F1-type ATP synthase membrane subunit b/b'